MQPEEFTRYRDAARAIAAILSSSNQIVLTTHVRPDGDALGSVLGLGNALSAVGKQPQLILPSPAPPSLGFLPGSSALEVYDASKHNALIATADAIVCLDFNVLDRLDAMAPAVAASPAVRLLVDHHLEPAPGFHAMLWDTEVASTAELVFALLLLEFPGAFSAAVAMPLYTGILTDTGNFRFPRTTARTHRIVAALIEYGADPVAIAEALYDQNSPARLRLLARSFGSWSFTAMERACCCNFAGRMCSMQAPARMIPKALSSTRSLLQVLGLAFSSANCSMAVMG